MTKQMIVLRTTPNGRQYYEINRGVAGALPSTKNHQGGIRDEEDESNGKMFECPGSARCPVQTVKNYLLIQKLTSSTRSHERSVRQSLIPRLTRYGTVIPR